MKKYLVVFLSFILLYLSPKNTLAADNVFSKTIHATYELQSNNIVKVTYDLKIVNKKTEAYAPSINLSTVGFSPQNVNAYENGISTPIKDSGDGVYQIVFKKPAVGIGASKHLVFTFTDATITEANSQITRIHLPQISGVDDFADYIVDLKVPRSLSEHASISPAPQKVTESTNFKIFTFSKTDTAHPITADFGEFQDYTFNITYLPISMVQSGNNFTIPLPSNTNYQEVSIKNITVVPNNVTTDKDGNWIASFSKKPKDPIVVSGNVRLYESPISRNLALSDDDKKLFLKDDPYWQITDPQIKAYAKIYKTPKEIYDFVVSYLSYNYSKTNRPVARLGASMALQHRNEAICMEFTDLFIAIARAAQIPAREVNGYAYTQNPDLQPLSLVSDILHSWPEYWDSDKKIWISVDPTWGNTTHGVDYFSKFDTNHFALVVKGVSSGSPVTPGTIQEEGNTHKLIEVTQESGFSIKKEANVRAKFAGISLFSKKLTISIKNTGSVVLPSQNLSLSGGSSTESSIWVDEIPPYGTRDVTIPFKDLSTVFYNEKSYVIEVPKSYSYVSWLLIVLVSFGIIVGLGMLKYRHEHNKISR